MTSLHDPLTLPCGQVLPKSLPIRLDEVDPALDIRASAGFIEPRFHRLGINQTIRLRELGQAAHAHAAMSAEEAPNPDEQHRRDRLRDEPRIVAEGFQSMRLIAVGAVSRRFDLFVIFLFSILFGGQRG